MRESISEDVLKEIKKLTKLELSSSVVRVIVRDYIERTYRVDVNNVRFLIDRETEGYGPMEHEVLRFKGCEITLKGE